ncbi:unnamed protein product [Nezara viridula]|uniref:Carboxylesterase type B domain-containing protein n=1 Tax=Nezara viridula TaxID=85310 RepID=A0A9P0HTX0_NEZVI|nr:unnamed protein product [Nezara viridula]
MTLLYLLVLVHVAVAVQVSTKSGKLKGDFIRNQFGSNYYAFRGIPYAKPMISNISSKDAQPIEMWNGVRDATIGWRSQPNVTNERQELEDCLYLTIYTRKIRRWLPPTMAHTYQTSPVEVYFQGCNINSKDNQTKSGTDNLPNDVVKVLIYHREIPSSSPGDKTKTDITTKDQLLALEWIKDNIVFFGGDPQRVAVFQGHSGLADIDINRLFNRANRT